MSAKFGVQRKRAFLTYLAQTGNQTLSAERAKVSRSWVSLHRNSDAAFDEACRAALRQARERLSAEGKRAPANRRWHFQGGHELVVSAPSTGSGQAPSTGSGRTGRVQVRRARALQWTARAEARFLAVLAETCNVRFACREVGLWPPTAYAHAARWPDFAKRWEQAVALGAPAVEGRVLENLLHFFDPGAPAPEARMPDLTVRDAIRLLRMYEKRDREKRRGS